MNKILTLLTITSLALNAQTFNVSTTPEFRTALQNAAMNGEDDTIILADGTYTTTDDWGGTFTYLDNEIYDLTLIGSDSKNVILSGAEQDQIFNHQSMVSADLKVEKLTFLDGGYELDTDGYPTNNGGGFETSKAIVTVLDCNFTNNHAQAGGGFYSAYGYSSNPWVIKNTSFTNNVASSKTYQTSDGKGGGFYAGADVNVTDCNFTNNRAYIAASTSYSSCSSGYGGGFYAYEAIVTHSLFVNNKVGGQGGGFYASYSNAVVKDSQFIENSAYCTYRDGDDIINGYTGLGGGFWAYGTSGLIGSRIENTLFHKNIAGTSGGGLYSSGGIEIIKSIFTENKTLEFRDGYHAGAGLCGGDTIISDSIIKDNHASSIGGGISVGTGYIINSIISNNYAQYKGGAINTTWLYMSNSILAHNNSGISLRIGTIEEPALIINSVFVDTNDSIIESRYEHEDPIVNINNSYIDLEKVVARNFESNNIFTGTNLGFVDTVSGDYHLTASSDLIDAGTSDYADKFIVDGVNYLERDLDDNNRSVGANMDMGVYEYSTTKPTIIDFTFTGEAKEYHELTFNVTYNLTNGRTVQSVEYDYMNDGNFETSDTHTYTEAKTYTVHARVTDDTGESSLRTISVQIEDLPYDDMTDEQKLKEAVDPQYYSDVLSIINASISDAEQLGQQYVIDNPSDFNLGDIQEIEDGCRTNPQSCGITPTVVVIPL